MHPLLKNRELVLVHQRGQGLSKHYDWYEARNAGHVDALYYPNGRAGTEIREFLAEVLDE